jgi:hypothetical protein
MQTAFATIVLISLSEFLCQISNTKNEMVKDGLYFVDGLTLISFYIFDT